MQEKLKKLEDILIKGGTTALGFSGGVDSTFLLYMLSRLNIKAIAYTFHSYIYPESELELAKELASKFNIRHKIIYNDPLNDIPSISKNPKDRCYICKHAVFSKIIEMAKLEGIERVIDGSNYDDLSDYRPGKRALEELGVKSPLQEAGFRKSEIRTVLRQAGLEVAEKPAFSCYFSRFDYGKNISKEEFDIIRECEEYLIDKLGKNAPFRLRFEELASGKKLGRIECSKDIFNSIVEKAEDISYFLQKKGFDYITLDLQGYRNRADK